MADAAEAPHGRQSRDKGKRPRGVDPEEGTSRGRHSKSRAVASTTSSRTTASKPSREEERRHKAIEKAFNKAQAVSSLQPDVGLAAASQPSMASTISPAPQRPTPALSPDRSIVGEAVCDLEAASVFPEAAEVVQSSSPQQPANQVPDPPTDQTSQSLPTITPPLALLISEAIRQGIAQGLQQKSAHPPEAPIHHRSEALSDQEELEGIAMADEAADSVSQDSLSEGEIVADQDLSDDEGLEPDQPAFIGLFRPNLFRSLLHKAQVVTGLGVSSSASSSSAAPTTAQGDSASSLFQEPSVQKEVIPAPKLFSDVVLRQWAVPSSGPVPNTLDKRFFNVAPEFSHLLQVPSVDQPVLALSSPSPVAGPSEECLRPEEKKAERTLIKIHQAAAWSVQASSAASFFNRATILWLRQLQARLPPSDHRSHQDLNKILAAVEFSADATLSAARFSAKAIGSSVTSRRLLWLRSWQADIRSKWRLASSPFSGEKLFGSQLDPLLIETKDHRKILPSLNRRPDNRVQPYFRPPSFRSSEPAFTAQRSQRSFPSRGATLQDNQVRYGARFGFKQPFRGARGRPFRKSR